MLIRGQSSRLQTCLCESVKMNVKTSWLEEETKIGVLVFNHKWYIFRARTNINLASDMFLIVFDGDYKGYGPRWIFELHLHVSRLQLARWNMRSLERSSSRWNNARTKRVKWLTTLANDWWAIVLALSDREIVVRAKTNTQSKHVHWNER